jgi:indolepyruvate ferredoxin oxidoreductase alpha subunit
MSGNEAIARGCVEAGVKVSTCYPGTPASEITDTLYAASEKTGMYVEYSTNEKVALEVAAGAAVTGVRSIASMKHVGLNVASDVLVTLAYEGVRGGCVIVSADDPGCWSSQNEQDNRYYAQLAGIPCLEPADAQEAKDMTIEAFEISERLEIPVLLRTTTRVNHTLSPVTLAEISKKPSKAQFLRDVKRFVPIPSHALIRHQVLLNRLDQAREISETIVFNKVLREGEEIGVITSGVSANYTLEALRKLSINASVLKLGLTHPLPPRLILDFVRRFNKIFIVEELEPILENAVRSIAFGMSNSPVMLGKLTGHLPRNYEYSTGIVCDAFCKGLQKNIPKQIVKSRDFRLSFEIPQRPPVLCPGCPHRASFYVMRTTLKPSTIYCTDIGCYSLGVLGPETIGDILICMGAAVGLASGVSRVQETPVLSIVGDSTFFHAAIPGLVNAVTNNHRIVVAVLDNMTTAMTGFQPHPGSLDSNVRGKHVAIEDVARGCGVEFVKVVDPSSVAETKQILKEAASFSGPSVVVLRHQCGMLQTSKDGRRQPYLVADSKCNGCLLCIRNDYFGCPAFYIEEEKAKIDRRMCNGCGFCIEMCPFGAIEQAG